MISKTIGVFFFCFAIIYGSGLSACSRRSAIGLQTDSTRIDKGLLKKDGNCMEGRICFKNPPGFEGGGDFNDETDTKRPFRQFKPTLAVRGAGCLVCHAQIKGDIISDFGFGDSYFLGKNNAKSTYADYDLTGDAQNDQYQKSDKTWATAVIEGSVTVPKASIQGSTLVPPPGVSLPDQPLAEYLRSELRADLTATVTPPVIEKESIFIGAPTEKRMREIFDALPSDGTRWRFKKTTSRSPALKGLAEVAGYSYVRNDPNSEFVCEGDLVVDAVLLLDHLKLRTNDSGCRIYSTASIFIQGAIEYLGESQNRNLQISSSRAILMGFGAGRVHMQHDTWTEHSLEYRLMTTIAAQPIRGFETNPQDFGPTVLADEALISELTDAALQPGGRDVHFERLLLNAPQVHSRYSGAFRGTIIAEIALFSLGTFSFEFDPAFKDIQILPLLEPSDYLVVSDE